MTRPYILVSNDDGYAARGLQALVSSLEEIADVAVVAPEQQQSGVGKHITLRRPLRARMHAPLRWAVDGTPTDCIYLAVYGLLSRKPDLVVSGINHGPNLAEDVWYSGTAAAALEAASMGIPAFAISHQSFEPSTFVPAAQFACRVAEFLLKNDVVQNSILNVNIPETMGKPVSEYVWTRGGRREYNRAVTKGVDQGWQLLLDRRRRFGAPSVDRKRLRGSGQWLRYDHAGFTRCNGPELAELNPKQRVTLRLGPFRFLMLALVCSCAGRQPQSVDHSGAKVSHPIVGVWYTVVAGDTVASISDRYGVPVEDIVELNGLLRPDKLLVGQPLFLYGIDELVKRLSKDGRDRSKASVGSRRRRRGRYKKLVGTLVWPVKGAVFTSGFGPRGRRKHKGIDLAHKPGTPIYSVAAGVVVYSDNKQRGYGNLVIIRHRRGVLSVYAHNKRNLVDEGDSVRQGAKIAELGNTGRSTGPHLHFELRVKGRAVNPLDYLPPKR